MLTIRSTLRRAPIHLNQPPVAGNAATGAYAVAVSSSASSRPATDGAVAGQRAAGASASAPRVGTVAASSLNVSDLAKRLASKSRGAAVEGRATKLIDRLKDHQLAAQWAKAVSLFDNYAPEARPWRWQSFHYRCLLDILSHAKQAEPVTRIWHEMKLRPETSMDAETLNDALVLAALKGDDALMADIRATMTERGFDLRKRGERAIEKRQAADWESALRTLTSDYVAHSATLQQEEAAPQQTSRGDSGIDAAATTAPAGGAAARDDEAAAAELRRHIPRALTELAYKHRRNADALAAVVNAMAVAGVEHNGYSYAARIRGCGSGWENALALLNECRERTTPNVETYTECMANLWINRKADQIAPVAAAMVCDGIAHNKRTAEYVLQHYSTTSRWADATAFFMTIKQGGVKPTNAAYSALVRCYNKAGQASRVMPVVQAMRADGFESSPRDTVSLINAWSRTRHNRHRY